MYMKLTVLFRHEIYVLKNWEYFVHIASQILLTFGKQTFEVKNVNVSSYCGYDKKANNEEVRMIKS